MNRYQFYGEIFNRGMKGEIITVKKAIKDLLKVAMENRVSNVTMALAKKMSFFGSSKPLNPQFNPKVSEQSLFDLSKDSEVSNYLKLTETKLKNKN